MSDSQSKKDVPTSTVIIYDGSQVHQWFAFDRQVLRHARRKYGTVGESLWMGTAVNIDNQTVNTIAQDIYWEIVRKDGHKEADNFWTWPHFWSVDYQQQWRRNVFQDLADYLESHTRGRAFQFMAKLEPSSHKNMRADMMKKFAKATANVVRKMEQELDAGLPVSKGGDPFPMGVDIEAKIEALEERQLTLWLLCPTSMRATYVYGQDKKLVRVTLIHASAEYRPDLNRMLDIHKLRLETAGSAIPEDADIEGYDDAWLPDWKKVRETLLSTWETLKLKSVVTDTKTLPSMFTPASKRGTDRNAGVMQCHGCGEYGHRRGDPACKAGPLDLHACAPPWLQEFKAKGVLKPAGSGTPSGSTRGRKVCTFFKKTGSCRFGQNCRFAHEKGGNSVNVNTVTERAIESVMNTVHSRIAQSRKNRKGKGRGRKPDRSDSDGSDSNGGSEDELMNVLLNATKPKKRSRKKTKRKKSIGMMVSGKKDNGPALGENPTPPLGVSGSRASAGADSHICMSELHSKSVVGWDTDASMFVTTNKQHMIPQLLNTDRDVCRQLSFNSSAGDTHVAGIGPAARATISTEDGKAYWIIEPKGAWLRKVDSGNDLTCYSAQKMKKLGLPMQQCYKGTDRDVVRCRRSGRVVYLTEENGILVLPVLRRMATDLGRIEGIEELVEDIALGRVSPLVPVTLRSYRRRASSATLLSQVEESSADSGGRIGSGF